MPWELNASAVALALCPSVDTLGKGTFRMYLSLRVPTHPFRVLGLEALGKCPGDVSVCR